MANASETAKREYSKPEVVDYGRVADLTKKPGSRGDGPAATKGNKGMGG